MASCIPGCLGLCTACQLLKVVVLSMTRKGRPPLSERTTAWAKAVSAATFQSRPSGSHSPTPCSGAPRPCQRG